MNDCRHTTVYRVNQHDGPPQWQCDNPSCRQPFVDASEATIISLEAQAEFMDKIASIFSAVLWDQTERMTEWLLGHGATQEEAEAEAGRRDSFFLDADSHGRTGAQGTG